MYGVLPLPAGVVVAWNMFSLILLLLEQQQIVQLIEPLSSGAVAMALVLFAVGLYNALEMCTYSATINNGSRLV